MGLLGFPQGSSGWRYGRGGGISGLLVVLWGSVRGLLGIHQGSVRGPSGVHQVSSRVQQGSTGVFFGDSSEVRLGERQVGQSVTIIIVRIFVQLLGVKTFSSNNLVDVN